MILSEAITKINYALRGLDDDAPSVGSDEWIYWTNVLNSKKNEVYRDVKNRWTNTFENRALSGGVSASTTPVYDLPSDFLGIASQVYIVTTGGVRINFDPIHPEEANPRARNVYVAGANPPKLYFTNEIISGENIIGGTIYVPGYYLPDDLNDASGDEELNFPDDEWGVISTAAEIAFNDIVYEDKAADLNEKANSLYTSMLMKNHRGTYNNPRRVPTRVRRIGRVRY